MVFLPKKWGIFRSKTLQNIMGNSTKKYIKKYYISIINTIRIIGFTQIISDFKSACVSIHDSINKNNIFIFRVITREADLVTAHEFGHNWGSEHDPDVPECSPSASHGGSYLMYTYSVSGYDVNNKKFSPCSLRFIRKVND